MSMRWLENRVPPLLIILTTGVCMAFCPPSPALQALPWAVRWFTIGLFLAVAALHAPPAIRRFQRARTTVNPLDPSQATRLIRHGPYGWTRNPMYVGLISILLAWAMYLGSSWAFLGPLAAALYLTRFQIIPEERALLQIFGAEYADYRRQVPRWL